MSLTKLIWYCCFCHSISRGQVVCRRSKYRIGGVSWRISKLHPVHVLPQGYRSFSCRVKAVSYCFICTSVPFNIIIFLVQNLTDIFRVVYRIFQCTGVGMLTEKTEVKSIANSVKHRISLHFNGHFPGGPGLAGTRISPFWILLEFKVMEMVVTTGAIRRAKLQSTCHHQQRGHYPVFYRLDAPSVAYPTVSKR